MMKLRDRIIAGERAAIAKAITLVESSREEDIIQSHELISELIKSPGHAIRVGFSGPPGVGKSTFIESFGSYIVNKNDGDLASQASKTASDYKSALSFYNKDSDALETQVVLVSSIENKGMDEVLDSYNKIVNVNKANNQFDKRRENQLAYWLEEEVRNKILLKLSSEKETSELLESEVRRIISGETGFYSASKAIIDRFLSKK